MTEAAKKSPDEIDESGIIDEDETQAGEDKITNGINGKEEE